MSYIGRGLQSGAFRQLDDISSGFDGSDTTHTMQVNSTNVTVGDVNQILLSLGGVIQKPGTDFTVSSSTLTFTTAPAANTSFFAVLLGSDNGGTVTPTDGSVTAGKLAIAGGEVKLDADGDTSITADTDDQIDFKAGGTDIMSLTATTATINDGLTVTVSDNTDNLTLISTDTDASYGPNIEMSRPVTGTTNDLLGRIDFSGQDAAGNTHNFFSIEAIIDDATSGAEYGRMLMRTEVNGATKNMFDMNGTSFVFNEDSIDYDFRVESDSSAYGFYLQAAHASNTGGTIGIASANSDGNRIESVNDQNGVWHMYMNNTHTGANPYGLKIRHGVANDDQNGWFIQCLDTSSVRFGVYNDGDVVNHDNSYGAVSDERIKEQIADASSQWDDVKAMKIRKYKMKEDVAKGDSDAHWRLGVVAQELEASSMNGLVKPEVQYKEGDQEVKDYLYTQKDKDQSLIPDGKDVGDVKQAKTADVGDIKTYKTVKYSVLYMKAIKALQEAMAKIETLEADVKTLKGE